MEIERASDICPLIVSTTVLSSLPTREFLHQSSPTNYPRLFRPPTHNLQASLPIRSGPSRKSFASISPSICPLQSSSPSPDRRRKTTSHSSSSLTISSRHFPFSIPILQEASSLFSAKMSFSGTLDKCKACEKTVYVVDSLTIDGAPFHKSCFKCTHCKGTLAVSALHLSLSLSLSNVDPLL